MSFKTQEILGASVKEREKKIKDMVKQYFEENRQVIVEIGQDVVKFQKVRKFQKVIRIENMIVVVYFNLDTNNNGEICCRRYAIRCEKMGISNLMVNASDENSIKAELEIEFYAATQDGRVSFKRNVKME